MSEIMEIFEKTFEIEDLYDVMEVIEGPQPDVPRTDPLTIYSIDIYYKHPNQVREWYLNNVKSTFIREYPKKGSLPKNLGTFPGEGYILKTKTLIED